MEALNPNKFASQIGRQLANLKIVSRLLAHELHAQQSSKQITLSREEVAEIQTCVDLFIEEFSRRNSGPGGTVNAATLTESTPLVAARIN